MSISARQLGALREKLHGPHQRRAFRHRRHREKQIDAEQCQADRAERHQTEFHPTPRQPLAQHGTDTDAQGEGGQSNVTTCSSPPKVSLE